MQYEHHNNVANNYDPTEIWMRTQYKRLKFNAIKDMQIRGLTQNMAHTLINFKMHIMCNSSDVHAGFAHQ